ncbi:MAG: sec-independent protein translocase protein TatA [Candidatus Azotimanducaceae bacterium]|jgi:sec-independent protein translocase protein TatA
MSFGVTELMIIAAIVLLLFGTTKLKSLGSDLGSAIKGFKSAMDDDKSTNDTAEAQLEADEPKPIPGSNHTAQSAEGSPSLKRENKNESKNV